MSHLPQIERAPRQQPPKHLGIHDPRLASCTCNATVKGSIPLISKFAYLAQMEQQDSCKFPFVSSTLTVGSISKYCAVAQLVERRAVNSDVAGSSPACTAMEMIRIGKGSVLKTDEAKAVQVRVHAISANYRSVVQPGRTADFESANLSSNLSRAELYASFNTSGLRPVKLETRVGFPSHTPNTVLSSSGLRRHVVSVNIEGSNPFSAAISACGRVVIPPACKADAATHPWCKSMRADQLSGTSSSAECPPWKREVSGAAPESQTICAISKDSNGIGLQPRHAAVQVCHRAPRPGMPTGRALSLKTRGLGVQISRGTYARIGQSVEPAVSKTAKCWFKSSYEHHAALVKLVKTAGLDPVFSEFESQVRHHGINANWKAASVLTKCA